MPTQLSPSQVLDVRGASCPIPILKARKALTAMAAGEILQVIATDPASVPDFQAMARTAKGIELLAQETTSDAGKELFHHYLARKA